MHSFKGMEEEVAPQQHPLYYTPQREITWNLPSFLSHHHGAKGNYAKPLAPPPPPRSKRTYVKPSFCTTMDGAREIMWNLLTRTSVDAGAEEIIWNLPHQHHGAINFHTNFMIIVAGNWVHFKWNDIRCALSLWWKILELDNRTFDSLFILLNCSIPCMLAFPMAKFV